MKERIGIGLLGLGTVGSGVYRIIKENQENLYQKIGSLLEIKKVLVKDIEKQRHVEVDSKLLTEDPSDVISDPEIDIIVELIGGVEPAKSFILKALDANKQVVTANKEIMADFGKEILEAAEKSQADLYFEASVGGGIPIIRPLKQCLAGNKISKVMGIVNGTTNYILSRMSEEGRSFAEALREAQEKGYAERNPEADIEGADAAAKIAILASIAFNSRVVGDRVYREGISGVSPEDITYAKEMDCVIKLLALAKAEGGELEVRVHPTIISKEHPLAAVKGAYNAIFVEGDAVGEVMFFGQGAGSMPTASAVMGDIIEVARNLQYDRTGKIACTCFLVKKIKSIEEIDSSYYLRMNVWDKPGVLAEIAKVFGKCEVSLASVIQKGPGGESAELVFITHQVRERNLRKALGQIEGLKVVNKINSVIRVEST